MSILAFESLPTVDLETLVINVTIARTGETIGAIRWRVQWRQYAYSPAPGTDYTRGVLIELRAKLGRLMRDWAKRQPVTPKRGAPRKSERQ